jgi:hypothetical protein
MPFRCSLVVLVGGSGKVAMGASAKLDAAQVAAGATFVTTGRADESSMVLPVVGVANNGGLDMGGVSMATLGGFAVGPDVMAAGATASARGWTKDAT